MELTNSEKIALLAELRSAIAHQRSVEGKTKDLEIKYAEVLDSIEITKSHSESKQERMYTVDQKNKIVKAHLREFIKFNSIEKRDINIDLDQYIKYNEL